MNTRVGRWFRQASLYLLTAGGKMIYIVGHSKRGDN